MNGLVWLLAAVDAARSPFAADRRGLFARAARAHDRRQRLIGSGERGATSSGPRSMRGSMLPEWRRAIAFFIGRCGWPEICAARATH